MACSLAILNTTLFRLGTQTSQRNLIITSYCTVCTVQYAVGKFRLTAATFMSRNAGVDNHLAISLSRTTSYENYPRALRSSRRISSASRRISSASRRIRPANRRIAAVAGGPPSAASGPLLCHRPACRHATPPPPPPSRPRLS